MRIPTRFSLRRLAGAVTAAAALALGAACNLQIGTGVEAKEDWTRSYTVRPGATLEIRETNGKIRIEATPGDKIEVVATRVTKASSEEAAKAALKDVPIGETASADRVALDSVQHGLQLTMGVSRRVDYDVKVPSSTNVVLKTTNGEVDVQGLGGTLTVDAVNGRVSATGLGSGADISSVNGLLTLEFVKLGDTGIRCKTINGQIVVTIPAASKATIAARAVNGMIRTQNLTVQASEESRRRLDATIGGGGPEVRLETTNGEVRIVGK